MNESVTFKKLNFQCCDSRFFGSSFFLKSVKSNTEFVFFLKSDLSGKQVLQYHRFGKRPQTVSGGTLLLLKA